MAAATYATILSIDYLLVFSLHVIGLRKKNQELFALMDLQKLCFFTTILL